MNKIRFSFFFYIFLFCTGTGFSQQVISLYGDNIPNSKSVPDKEEKIFNKLVDTVVTNISIPKLIVFLPPEERSTGTAVIIVPGGGYHALLIYREGRRIAEAFNRVGVAAFVLKYRLPNDRIMLDKSIGPLQDAQEAIKIVRQRASEWNINTHSIGIMGFSAGGHLAATVGTHFDHAFIENKKNISLRPDFMLLINPVISFTDSIGHLGSRNNLLGLSPSEIKIKFYSNELQVNNRTPSTFLVHTTTDSVVSPKNSLFFFKALQRNGVPVELHLYGKGEHGFLTAPPFDEWFGRCLYWMKMEDWVK
jgi:acetyl esterase/lipase